MKRDVQVGVILGVIILAIIGVFLSTRTAVKEPVIPIPEIEEDTQVGALNINELTQDFPGAPQESFKEVKTSINTGRKESAVTNAVKTEEPPSAKEDKVIEGVWKPAKEGVTASVETKPKEASSPSNQEDWKDVSSPDVNKSVSSQQTHKVQYRDDLYKIAKKYYGDVSKWLLIFNANKDKILDRNSLRIGTELIIPEDRTVSPKTKTEATTPQLSQVIQIEDAKPTAKKHVVQQGDTLYKLAVKYYNDGTKWNKIFDANKKTLKNQKDLSIGQELEIPDF
ncbi:MAG: hypothetical protein A2099_00210 [Planctomycetes bacterium GWF2_39_10]|nr:MAG: hypothetical protein A2Y11_01615 [Planctomycetes bacterium GWC2_39_26]OHB48239.1 MAG: hypothetical protein A2099_00210 [Planctomycetes bacterium GWF2_39_10]